MAKKKKEVFKKAILTPEEANASIIGSGLVAEQPISDTLKTNYMPYAMSVIISRAIPEIDGFKPAHRKLLYTMYTMGLLKGNKTKSANIVGQTMKLNPHGDAAIYDTLVRLTRANEALLHPYVDSKGNFGKAYSRDMQASASRYTEAKLDAFAEELFKDINKETVTFVDNYDATLKEPTLFPVTFPSILVNANVGIAVGMASNICPFNLKEVCDTTIGLIRNPDHDICETLLAPDFPGGGNLIYKREDIENIYNTGRGSFKVRATYKYDKANNCIEIVEIPPTTSCEQVIEKVIDLVKLKKITEINDIRDETDINGMSIAIDLKRGIDPDKFMAKLYKLTSLEDSFSCNFNVLIGTVPKVMGVGEILEEWIAFRMECVRARVFYDFTKTSEKLHLLKGLSKILLDIDKAVRIVRETEAESDVVPNLMIGFGIDEIQANYVAEIKLRHLNREYILNRLKDVEDLEKEKDRLEGILNSKAKIKGIIVKELEGVAEKYGKERLTKIIAPGDEQEYVAEEEVPDYPVHIFFTKEGYFKKVTPQSLRMSNEQKLKENDEIYETFETTNRKELLFFTDKHQVYKTKISFFDDTKISSLGDYVPSKLEMDEGERAIYMALVDDYKGNMLFFFENGKVAKVDMKAYYTKNNRKKLISAYCEKMPLTTMMYAPEECEFVMESSNGRMLLVNSAVLAQKTTKNTQGVAVMTQKKGHRLIDVSVYKEGMFNKPYRYRSKTLPAAGSIKQADTEQLSLI